MIEKILGLGTGVTLTDLGALAALTTIIVQVIKNLLPKKVPTQIVTIVVSLLLSITTAFVYFNANIIKSLGIGVIMGCVVAFAAMNGFDTLKSVWLRFNPSTTIPEIEDGEEVEDKDIGGEE